MPVVLDLRCSGCGASTRLTVEDAAVEEMARRAGLLAEGVPFRYALLPLVAAGGTACFGHVWSAGQGHELILRLADGQALTVPVRKGAPLPPAVIGGRAPAAWGLAWLGPGTWRMSPSIVEGKTHLQVLLVGVPDPAPWEAADPAEVLAPEDAAAARRACVSCAEVKLQMARACPIHGCAAAPAAVAEPAGEDDA